MAHLYIDVCVAAKNLLQQKHSCFDWVTLALEHVLGDEYSQMVAFLGCTQSDVDVTWRNRIK